MNRGNMQSKKIVIGRKNLENFHGVPFRTVQPNSKWNEILDTELEMEGNYEWKTNLPNPGPLQTNSSHIVVGNLDNFL